ncbi:large ribosomal subunit protein mL50-like [Heterodontus francisci]|uniref:large ribosomal subunit protein mL50-like n=1 Tax=Heterodontus francisci TaxID=7792 RepID=UPI00355C10FA
MAAQRLVVRLRPGVGPRGPWVTAVPARRQSGAAEEPRDPILSAPPIRSRKYSPPPQLEEVVRAAVERATGLCAAGDWRGAQLGEGERFHLLRELAQVLSHPVPNSQLHQMRSPGDLLHFYQQPTEPDPFVFQELTRSVLPTNLRVNWGYERSRGGGGDGSNPGQNAAREGSGI